MPTRILLIRHGQTDWSLADRFTGSSDVPLNQTGRAQAQALGRRLASAQSPSPGDALTEANILLTGEQRRVAAIYSSPLARSLETARSAAELLQLPVETLPELREMDFGAWEGLLRSEIKAQYAQEFEQWRQNPAVYAPPAGENGLSVVARAHPVITQLVAAHPKETIIVAAHKTVNRLLICSLLDIPLKQYRSSIEQDVTCLNVIDFLPGNPAMLVKLNDTAHYEVIEAPV